MDHEMDENIFLESFFRVMTLQGHTNQITCLIETMDKLTKEGEHRIATETLKACFGSFFVVLKGILHFLQYWKCLWKWASIQQIKLFRAVTVLLCIKQLRFYAWLQKNGCRDDSSHCDNKKLSVTDDINQCE